jgi:hypothetical protein
MSVRQIAESRWPEFLEEFSRSHRSWLARVDHAGPDAPPVVAGEHALRSVTASTSAGRVMSIDIRFQEEVGGDVRIQTPTRVGVDETDEGRARGLEIVDDHGNVTRIQFRATPLPEMLDGLAPGEFIDSG